MADRVPRRMGPVWVWALGLVIVVLGIWLLVDWVGKRDEAATAAGVPAAAEMSEEQAAREEAEREAAIAEVEGTSVPVPLGTILPLGAAHTGIQATFDGTVAAGGEESVWVRTGDGPTILVRVVDGGEESALEAGERVAGRGIVRHDPQRVAAALRAAGLAESERSRVVSGYYLETTTDRLRAR